MNRTLILFAIIGVYSTSPLMGMHKVMKFTRERSNKLVGKRFLQLIQKRSSGKPQQQITFAEIIENYNTKLPEVFSQDAQLLVSDLTSLNEKYEKVQAAMSKKQEAFVEKSDFSEMTISMLDEFIKQHGWRFQKQNHNSIETLQHLKQISDAMCELYQRFRGILVSQLPKISFLSLQDILEKLNPIKSCGSEWKYVAYQEYDLPIVIQDLQDDLILNDAMIEKLESLYSFIESYGMHNHKKIVDYALVRCKKYKAIVEKVIEKINPYIICDSFSNPRKLQHHSFSF